MLYLSQTRDVWLGGTALFSLAAGMSVPLLLVGASAGALLPRAGAWMVEVKAAFGVLLLGVALWTVQPVLPGALALGALGRCSPWARAALLVMRARAVGPAPRRRRAAAAGLASAVGALLGLVGVLQVVGAASGATDPLQPLARFAARSDIDASPGMPRFPRVRSVDELDAALRTAGRPVMLDFYADWCVSCKEMERFTFTDPAVQEKLAGALLLKADVTANNADDRALLKRFSLFGPPGNDLLRCRAATRFARRRRDRLPEQPRLRRDPGQGRALSGARGRRRVKLRLPVARWSSLVARWAHNPKVAGSNPALATTEFEALSRGLRRLSMTDHALAETRAWVDRAVIGLQLCPFAKAPQVKGQVRYVASEAVDADALLSDLVEELKLLAAEPPDAHRDDAARPSARVRGLRGSQRLPRDRRGRAGRARPRRRDPDRELPSRVPLRGQASPTTSPTRPTGRRTRRCTCCARRASSARSPRFADPDSIFEANIATIERLGPEGWAELDAAAATTPSAAPERRRERSRRRRRLLQRLELAEQRRDQLAHRRMDVHRALDHLVRARRRP